MDVTSPSIWINPIVGVLTITSLWPVAIMFMNTNNKLRSVRMVQKYALYQVSASRPRRGPHTSTMGHGIVSQSLYQIEFRNTISRNNTFNLI